MAPSSCSSRAGPGITKATASSSTLVPAAARRGCAGAARARALPPAAPQQQPSGVDASELPPGALTARALRATGLNAVGRPLAPVAPARFQPDSVLPLVSSAVESSAQMASFEAFAGRSAMVGFLVALCLEWGTERSTFTSLPPDQAAAVAAAAGASLLAASVAAAAAARRPAAAAAEPEAGAAGGWWWLGARIHEAVMSSLTATKRSASGVTQLRVDEAVDFVIDACLTQSVHPAFGPRADGGSGADARPPPAGPQL